MSYSPEPNAISALLKQTLWLPMGNHEPPQFHQKAVITHQSARHSTGVRSQSSSPASEDVFRAGLLLSHAVK